MSHVVQSRRVRFGEGHESRVAEPAAVWRDEDAHKGSSLTVVAQYLVGAHHTLRVKLPALLCETYRACDIQIAAGAEQEALRSIQSSAPSRNEGAEKCSWIWASGALIGQY